MWEDIADFNISQLGSFSVDLGFSFRTAEFCYYVKRYQRQIRHVGRDKRTNISSYNSMNTKHDSGPQRQRTRAQSLYKAY